MKTNYLLSVLDWHEAIYETKIEFDRAQLSLKPCEVVTLRKMCNIFLRFAEFDSAKIMDGYYVGYSIPQIGNEFDLLRFGKDEVINIELKSSISQENKVSVIKKQLEKQYYYLNFCGKKVLTFSYVEDDGFYMYDPEKEAVEPIDILGVLSVLESQEVEFDVDLTQIFKPSNYLVSPFNNVFRFINNEYFLTTDQAKKKKEILGEIELKKHQFFCVSANAGTGKTLLIYDIAKTYQARGKKVVVIHCATLNEGQNDLCTFYGWDIRPVKDLRASDIEEKIGNPDLIVVDEAHRMWKTQLKIISDFVAQRDIPILFAYDVKQSLKSGENKDIHLYLHEHYPDKTAPLRTLTTKIRTNKQIASFINNMYQIGSSQDNLNYECITIEYFKEAADARAYMDYLSTMRGWKAITYTASRFSVEPVDSLAPLCETKAHGVIGQEFEKVVFPMDSNFIYNEKKHLVGRKNYYSLRGMLYQIVTRAVSELKIVVIDNFELYKVLLSIKHMG